MFVNHSKQVKILSTIGIYKINKWCKFQVSAVIRL